jgi:hypothetical protein
MGAEKVVTQRRWLVIVDNLDIVGIAVMPKKTESPLVIDANAMLTLSVGSQWLQPVPGRACHVSQDHCTVQLP